MGRVPNALVVNPKVTAKTVAEFIAHARANPGKITAATQGNGTTSHLTSEMFQMMANVKFQHVPYRGSAPALQDLVAGNVDIMFDNLGVSLALVKGGKLKLIAVATPEAHGVAAGRADDRRDAARLRIGRLVRASSRRPRRRSAIADKINADINEALRQPEIRQRLADLSAEPIGGTPQATASYMREEVERWHKVIKAADSAR